MTDPTTETDPLLTELTDPQREAVTTTEGPVLVLAAAGSGKTRVITRRAAYLVRGCGIEPWAVLSITFTNKAAGEMRQRITTMLSDGQARAMPIGTFHSLCARLLRIHFEAAGVSRDFLIFDAADQKKAIKDAFKELDVATSHFEPGAIASTISDAKNRLIDAETYASHAGDFYTRTVARLYRKYEAIKTKCNALDFDDLLMNTAHKLQSHEETRTELQQRYQYVQIDEYQDTNHAQFVIAHALAASHRNLCVVGDPDQSIYGWRGANIANILDFETHYPGAVTIKLGQNYRSTPQILKIADTLIERNKTRKPKPLFTENAPGSDVSVVELYDEHREAEHVVDFLRKHHDESGVAWGNMAVFYRVNALSRVMEEHLMRASIPYMIARGTAFYQRKEVKDALAYIRLCVNKADEVSLSRIINMPTRGIGATSVQHLQAWSVANGQSMDDAMHQAPNLGALNARAVTAVTKFRNMLDTWRAKVDGADEKALGFIPGVRDVVEMVVRDSGLEAMYKDGKHADEDKLANLYELVSAAQQFDEQYAERFDDPDADLRQKLHDYLESVALVADSDAIDPEAGSVTLMTLHAAKGLEFPVVAMLGLEEGLLPHSRSRDSIAEMEEERRLCFVGITRAEQHLMMTHARYRTVRGLRERTIPSPFLKEIGEEGVVREDQSDWGTSWDDTPGSERSGMYGGRSAYDEFDSPTPTEAAGGLRVGQRVEHPQFGLGRIEALTPTSAPTRAKVYFDRFGAKTLVLEYARLEAVE